MLQQLRSVCALCHIGMKACDIASAQSAAAAAAYANMQISKVTTSVPALAHRRTTAAMIKGSPATIIVALPAESCVLSAGVLHPARKHSVKMHGMHR